MGRKEQVKEKVTKKVGKRPRSAYIQFCMEVRKELAPKNLSIIEVSKECGKRWKSLGENEKNALKARAKKYSGAFQQQRQKAERQVKEKMGNKGLSKYAAFVKANIQKAREELGPNAKPTEVMKHVATLYHKSKN